ncbi:hypothetical protein [Teredinibacter haidensis]|uniref:hypothetical protein n=1 Tax=Teredinibacter haidensis TaxID=2731755 RepID=UPI000948D418|nr:hypothetical protein [Teredinibacter haidensis]
MIEYRFRIEKVIRDNFAAVDVIEECSNNRFPVNIDGYQVENTGIFPEITAFLKKKYNIDFEVKRREDSEENHNNNEGVWTFIQDDVKVIVKDIWRTVL